MWWIPVGLIALYAGDKAYKAYKRHAAKTPGAPGATPGVPGSGGTPAAPGTPGTPSAPSNAPPAGASNGITKPGQPQPPGTVVVPPLTAPVTDALHNTAATLVQFVQKSAPDSAAHPEVSAFQTQYNVSSPLTALQVDGKYGPKTQAALQAVIAPATAPTNWFPSKTIVLPPANPAPPPVKNVDVATAANALIAMGSIPKASLPQVSTFQHAYNQHNVPAHLVEDGKYGPLSQGALQAVINAMGSSQPAPKNPYGAAPKAIPVFTDSLTAPSV